MRTYFILIVLIIYSNLYADDRGITRLSTKKSPIEHIEKRLALVIGNNEYHYLPSLENAVSDAQAITEKLTTLGFDVILETDANQARIQQVIKRFIDKLAQAEDNTVGLFYYSGHGIEAKGVNYLLPIGEVIKTPQHLENRAIQLKQIFKGFANLEKKQNNYFIILDACRNNPLGGKGWGRPENINFSIKNISWFYGTGYGQKATDNQSFTQSLLKYLSTKGATTEQIFKRVIEDVTAYNSNQVPVMGGSATDDFIFYPGTPLIIKQQQKIIHHKLIISSLMTLIILLFMVFLFYLSWLRNINLMLAFVLDPEIVKQTIHKSHLAKNEIKGFLKDLKTNKIIGIIPSSYSITLGRNKNNNIMIERTEVSKQHVTIGWDNQKKTFWIQDLNSTNGTWWGKNNPISQEKQTLKPKKIFYLIDRHSPFTVIKYKT